MRAADLFLYLHAVAALNIKVGRRRALAGCFSGAVGLVAVPSRSRATGAADELYELVRTRRPSQWQDSERARVDELVEAVVSQNAPWRVQVCSGNGASPTCSWALTARASTAGYRSQSLASMNSIKSSGKIPGA